MRTLLVALVIGVLFSACGDGTGEPPGPPAEPPPAETSTLTALTSTPRATATPVDTPTPTPSPTPHIEVLGPIYVDGVGERLYTAARVADRLQIVALSAGDGSLLRAYQISGPFAVDGSNQRLFIDDPARGLLVLDTESGETVATVDLPPPASGVAQAPPQFDPVNNDVFLFRDGVIHVVDGVSGEFRRTLFTDVRLARSELLPVAGADYDPIQRVLYLTFSHSPADRVVLSALVAYAVDGGEELGRQELTQTGAADITTAVWDGVLYGRSRHIALVSAAVSFWKWTEGQPAFEASGWRGSIRSGPILDRQRGVLYAATDDALLVLDRETLALVSVVPKPPGEVVAYDGTSDRIYFLLPDGRLTIHTVEPLLNRPPAALAAERLPPHPVRRLWTSPLWPEDGRVFGIWQRGGELEDAMPLGRSGGLLFQGRNDPDAFLWERLGAGLAPLDRGFTTLAISPAFAQDRTLYAASEGLGVFRSNDGGTLWRPTGAGLGAMTVDELLLSDGTATDGTLFAHSLNGELYRSQDGGRGWLRLTDGLRRVAISPEFSQDATLLAVGDDTERGIYRSQDGGGEWRRIGAVPGGDPVVALSIAPLYAEWGVAFALTSDGTLYRSQNGGQSWTAVLGAGAQMPGDGPFSGQIAYAPDIEVDRPVFLLVTPHFNPIYNTATGYQPARPPPPGGMLFRSTDGGQNWQQVAVPAGVEPTALALSPGFPGDDTLLLGTPDGRVLPVAASDLVPVE